MPESVESIVERLPSPDEVRMRLAENLREANILRSLLKLSQKAEKDLGRSNRVNTEGQQ